MNAPNPAESFPELNLPVRTLLGPGPSTADPRVLRAMAAPLVGHLDPTFLALMDRTQVLLRQVFETENAFTLAVPGTGSAGMEAALANVIEPGDAVLVCSNGFFSLRMAEMARRFGGEVRLITRPWGEVFTAQEIQAELAARPAKIVALVHAETSTGALQPLNEIAAVVHAHGALFLVDAVTSLGGLPVRVDEVGIDICYSGSQKCLGCPPGLAPITLSPAAEEVLQRRKAPLPGWYLDLTLLQKYWGSPRLYHHTAPISTHYALYEGLRLAVSEGLAARWERHARNARLLWDGIESLGLSLHVPLEYRLPSLTTVRIPEGVDDLQIRSRLLNEYNIEIGGGLGELKGKVWRVGLMGYASRPENVLLLLAALKTLLGY
ncbi:MAG TPA: alanine--glyoxylate aminotransferase family protein [Anaerolineales bacterium]|nr:alanine--glyoxylate aminotransferase family protein [Anaerolineales bacterium]